MRQKHIHLALLALLAAAAVPGVAVPIDPEPGFEEFHPSAAVRPDGAALLTWTRQEEPGGPWTAMAATLDPVSGQLGEAHEWGAGGVEQVVALNSGYLGLRLNVNPNPSWFVQCLDAEGRPVGAALELGFLISALAYETPGGGAIVVAGGVTGTGGPARAWRFGPDGALLSGPVTLVDNSIEAAVGMDAAGNLVLAWTDQGGRLFARRFSTDLQPLGPVLNVALGGGAGLRIAVAPDGRFVVVFTHSYRLYARAYRANGTSLGQRRPFSAADELVNPLDLDLALGEDGRILVAWKTYENLNMPVIRARALSFAGRPLTNVSRLARLKVGRGELLRPSVETLPGGGFLVLWSRVEADGETATLESKRVSGR
jgi:hypothetical protein